MKVMTVDEQRQLRYKMFLLGTSCLARNASLSKYASPSDDVRSHRVLASHTDILRGTSRVPAREQVTNP